MWVPTAAAAWGMCGAAPCLPLSRQAPVRHIAPAPVIRYQLHNLLPVVVTDLSRSHANGFATRDYIPGTAVRGMVLHTLAQQNPDWFEEHKEALLTKVCFLDAVPCPADWEPLPPMMGFYSSKGEDAFVSVLNQDVAGKKRVDLGTCCRPEGNTLHTWRGITGGTMRIARQKDDRQDALPFQVQYLEAGQSFTGYILLQDPQLAPAVSRVFEDMVWLGADRHSGFGQCRVTACTTLEQPGWEMYSYGVKDPIGKDLYLLALTPLGLLNAWGEPCGLSEQLLSEKLGVEVTIAGCSTALKEFSGFNRTWQCRVQHQRMYDRGSLFHLHCAAPPPGRRWHSSNALALEFAAPKDLGKFFSCGRSSISILRKNLPQHSGKNRPCSSKQRSSEGHGINGSWSIEKRLQAGDYPTAKLEPCRASASRVRRHCWSISSTTWRIAAPPMRQIIKRPLRL